MPELPEVETVRRQLAGELVATTFVSVEKVEAAMLRDCEAQQLWQDLPGRRVEEVDRLGKFLVIRLSEGLFLTLHLGMTGQLLVSWDEQGRAGSALRPGDGALWADPHGRFLFVLADDHGQRLRLEFRDMRKFGRLHLTSGSPAPRLQALGPDAWRGAWDRDYLAHRLEGKRVPLKAFLLDQRQLAGIGNIYADEILWWAQLSPLRPSGSLSSEEITRLAAEIPRRLGEGVRLLGCSFSDFVDTQGRAGAFQNWLQAYGRHGQVCSRCGGILKRVLVGGRGTAYCPRCQV